MGLSYEKSHETDSFGFVKPAANDFSPAAGYASKTDVLLKFCQLAADHVGLLLCERKITACHACRLLDGIGTAGGEYADAFGLVVKFNCVVHGVLLCGLVIIES